MQNNVFYTNKTLNIRGKLIDLGIPRVMGILNVTPDSFFDGGKFTGTDSILGQVQKMLDEGADFIDIGGYSSRPGATNIPPEEEEARVLPVIKLIAKEFPRAVLSIDTFRAGIARQAVTAGASIINDISGGEQDPLMFDTVAAMKVPFILMHMRGTPQTMSSLTVYENLIKDILDYFHQRIFKLRKLGVKDIIIDPGFGFSKTTDQNFKLLDHLRHFEVLGLPILAGLSRKSMIWRTLGSTAQEALTGTIALNTVALSQGARILRVHDVKEAVACVKLFSTMQESVRH